MADRLANLALQRPGVPIGLAAVVLAGAIALAAGTASHVGLGSLAAGDAQQGTEFALVTTGDVPVGSRVYGVSLDAIASKIRLDDDVERVRRGPVSRDDRTTALVVTLRPSDPAEQRRAVERIEDSIDPGSLEVSPAGTVPVAIAARHDLADQLWKLELLALPFALLVLAATLGVRIGGGAALCGAVAVAGTLAGLRLAAGPASVSLLGAAPGSAVGLALGIDMVALLAARFRDEGQLAGRTEAMRRTVVHGTRAAALAVAGTVAATAGLLATPLDAASSIVFACGLAAALAAGSALLVAPAFLALAPGEPESPVIRAPRAAVRSLARHRLVLAAMSVLAVAALLALAFPALDGESGPLAAGDLPSGDATRTATEFLDARFGAGGGDAALADRSLFEDLPLAAGISVAALALVALAAFRSPRGLIAVVPALLPAAAACGLAVLVFQQGHLAGALGQAVQHALENGAVAALLAALTAIAGVRCLWAAWAARGERNLGIAAERASELAAAFTMPGAIAATLVVAAGAGVLAGAHLYPARELGLALAAGLLLDLIGVRTPLLAALGRWGAGADSVPGR